MSDQRELHRRLLRLLGPGTSEVSCDECFEQLDAFVDAEAAGTDADAAFPGMRAHLAGCPACGEEHDALIDLVRSERET